MVWASTRSPFNVVLCDLGLPDNDRALSRAAGFAHLTKPLPLSELMDILERRDGD
ncbi:hypothetical protein ACFYZ2_06700 [Streptomyces sviceus]|uniref:hypothetical protein n=1 Tax=Streptomyces sviceus TaxID=285530 RepID=UPI0036A06BD5